MPPKSKISKEMILSAAFKIVRESGVDNMNARNIAEKLGCSTQPVLYCFKSMDEIRQEVYAIADGFHSEYLMQNLEQAQNPMYVIGSNYIRFGCEEKNLFRFLFQSNSFSGQMQGLFEDERLAPIIGIMSTQMGISAENAKKIFAAIYYSVHGIASLLANNAMEYREDEYKEILDMIFTGVMKEMGDN